MLEANSTYRHGRFETHLVASVCEMSNAKAFATQDGQLAGLVRLTTKIRMIPIGIKKKNLNLISKN